MTVSRHGSFKLPQVESVKQIFLSENNVGAALNDYDTLSKVFGIHTRPSEVMCVASERIDEDIAELCSDYSQKYGVRVYLLLGNDQSSLLVKEVSETCIVRTGVPQNGLLIINDPGKDTGKAWISPSGNIKKMFLVDDYYYLYQTFCHLFWEKASGEIRRGNKAGVGKAPIEHFFVPDQCCLPGNLVQTILDEARELPTMLINVKDIEWFNASKIDVRRTIINIGTGNYPKTISLPENSEHVEIAEGYDIGCSIIESGGVALLFQSPGKQTVNWSVSTDNIKLSDVKVQWKLVKRQKITEIQSGYARLPEKLGDLLTVKEEGSVNLGVVEAETFDSYFNDDAGDICFKHITPAPVQNGCIYRNVVYSAEIVPPQKPPGAVPDEIEKEWARFDSEWNKELDRLKAFFTDVPKQAENWEYSIDERKNIVNESEELIEVLSGFPRDRIGKNTRGQLEELSDRIEFLRERDLSIRATLEICRSFEEEMEKYIKKRNDLEKQIKEHDAKKAKLVESKENVSTPGHSDDSNNNENTKNPKKGTNKKTNVKKNKQKGVSNFESQITNEEQIISRLKAELESYAKPVRADTPSSSGTLAMVLGNKPLESAKETHFSPPKELLPETGFKVYSAGGVRYVAIDGKISEESLRKQLEKYYKDAERLKAKLCMER